MTFGRKRNQGSVLMVTLVVCTAIGVVLASVLTLVSQRHKLTVRSMAWSSALAIAEAGVEEALSHWHLDYDTPGANGWTTTNISGQTVYLKTRTFSDGSYFVVTTYNALSNTPVIYSAGFAPSPLQSGAYIPRMVKVTTTNPPSAWVGISANRRITFSGNGVVDGYSSSVGAYNSTTNRTASVKLASNYSGFNSAVGLNNTVVCGSVVTGPGGVVGIGPAGSLGDLSWVEANTGIQPGATNNNMNVAFPSNAPPSGGPFLPPAVTSVGGSNVIYLGNVTNQAWSITSSSATEPLIVTGNATLWVTQDLTLADNGYIAIRPGASLTLYVGGTAKFGGHGVVNETRKAQNFTYRGLSSNTSIMCTNTTEFFGTFNAPQARMTLAGDGAFYGAVICNRYVSLGSGAFHFDRALGGGAGSLVLSWAEL